VEALRRATLEDEHPLGEPQRVLPRLAELRLRNPRHHRAVELVYQEQVTPIEAADELAVDVWALRAMVARALLALLALAQSPERRERPTGDRGAGSRPAAKPARTGNRAGQRQNPAGQQKKRRPPAGGRPR
jgi:hypothetical protein